MILFTQKGNVSFFVSGVTHCVYLKHFFHFFWLDWSIDTRGMCQVCSSVDKLFWDYSVNLINHDIKQHVKSFFQVWMDK